MLSPPTPSSEQILDALSTVLRSPLFKRAERQSRLLRFIVEHTVKGELNALREVSLGVEVYDRPPDFDPKDDTIVRVEASRLRSRLAEYYDGEGKADPVRISLPRGGYVPAFAFVQPPEAPPAAVAVSPPPPKVAWKRPAVLGLTAILGAMGFWYLASSRRNSAPEVEQLLKQYLTLATLYTPASLEQARKLLERAEQLDPKSAEVQGALSDVYAASANTNAAQRQQFGAKALLAARRARDLAPDSPIGHSALIRYYRDIEQNLAAARLACQEAQSRVFAQQPFLGVCATVESYLGNHEVAWTLAEQNVERNPRHPGALRTLGVVYYNAGLLDRAEVALRKTAEVADKGRVTHWEYLGLIGVAKGKAAEALAELDREAPYSASSRADLYAFRGYVAAKAGRREEAMKMIGLLRAAIEKGAPPAFLSWVYLGLGDSDAALACLEQSVERRDDVTVDFVVAPAAAELRPDPRFQAVQARLGLPRQPTP
jgi:Tfp pilus assembly protein PilF